MLDNTHKIMSGGQMDSSHYRACFKNENIKQWYDGLNFYIGVFYKTIDR